MKIEFPFSNESHELYLLSVGMEYRLWFYGQTSAAAPTVVALVQQTGGSSVRQGSGDRSSYPSGKNAIDFLGAWQTWSSSFANCLESATP